MKAHSAHIAQRAKRLRLIRCAHALRGIFHHPKLCFLRNVQQLFHIGCHARIMHGHNAHGARGDGGLQAFGRNVLRGGIYIAKYRHCATCQHRVGCGREII